MLYNELLTIQPSMSWASNLKWIPKSELFLDLLLRIFKYDAKDRIEAHEATVHPFFNEYYE